MNQESDKRYVCSHSAKPQPSPVSIVSKTNSQGLVPTGNYSIYVKQNPTKLAPSAPFPPVNHENETNFGSRGIPSGPILFFANRCSVYILRASLKSTFLLLMIFSTSRFPRASRPERESPSVILPARSKSDECSPASTSSRKVSGMRW